jgi:undecaprenyl-diphosphatase
MMTAATASILGIIEGLTEFLPVSSTFHLIMTTTVLGLAATPYQQAFEVIIQGGAILAVLFLYTRAILTNRALMLRLAASFLPTMVVGFALYKVIKGVFFVSPYLTLMTFVVVGLLFLWAERQVATGRYRLVRSLDTLTFRDALWIGLAQAIAVIPGVSRSGAVIVAMMRLGYTRESSARYTFMLSLPTILAASLYDAYKSRAAILGSTAELGHLGLGSLVSFAVALAVSVWFIRYLKSHDLKIFAYYRFAVALVYSLYLLIVARS